MLLPKVTKTLLLSEYNEAYPEQIEVWVNAPRKYWGAVFEPQGEMDKLAAALAEIWDWDLEKTLEFVEACDQQDPQLLQFAYMQTLALYAEYRTGSKKVGGSASTS